MEALLVGALALNRQRRECYFNSVPVGKYTVISRSDKLNWGCQIGTRPATRVALPVLLRVKKNLPFDDLRSHDVTLMFCFAKESITATASSNTVTKKRASPPVALSHCYNDNKWVL